MRRLSFECVVASALFLPLQGSLLAQVDCVYPGSVSVSRVQGQVFDPFGTIVPGALITLLDGRGKPNQTKSDEKGFFYKAVPPGKYSFKATFPMFETSQTELNVGEDLLGLIHPRTLRVLFGLSGSYCSWLITSQKEMRSIISSNKKRSEEAVQRNATQK